MMDHAEIRALLKEPFKRSTPQQWQELQALVSQYPFYATLRLLVARQATYHQPSASAELSTAAAHAPNRLMLRRVMETRAPGQRSPISFATPPAGQVNDTEQTVEPTIISPSQDNPASEANEVDDRPLWMKMADAPPAIPLEQEEAEMLHDDAHTEVGPLDHLTESDQFAEEPVTDELLDHERITLEGDGPQEDETLFDNDLGLEVEAEDVLAEEELAQDDARAYGELDHLDVEIDLSDLGISAPQEDLIDQEAATTDAWMDETPDDFLADPTLTSQEDEALANALLEEASDEVATWPGLDTEEHVDHATYGENPQEPAMPSAYVAPDVTETDQDLEADAVHTFMLGEHEEPGLDADFIVPEDETVAEHDIATAVHVTTEPAAAFNPAAQSSEADDMDALIAEILSGLDQYNQVKTNIDPTLDTHEHEGMSATELFEHELHEGEHTTEELLAIHDAEVHANDDHGYVEDLQDFTDTAVGPVTIQEFQQEQLDEPSVEQQNEQFEDAAALNELLDSLDQKATFTSAVVDPEIEEPSSSAKEQPHATADEVVTPEPTAEDSTPIINIYSPEESLKLNAPLAARTEEQEILDKFLEVNPKMIKPAPLADDDPPVYDLSAQNTVLDDDDITENLAQIMVKQGKTERAIEIYCKLILKNPEKTPYFASRINAIAGGRS